MGDAPPLASQIRLRRAREEFDWRALRMLLPEAIHYGCGCDAFVATDDASDRRVVGAIAVTPLMRLAPSRGPRVALHVIPSCRRRGIGRALVNVAIGAAAAQGATALYAWDRVGPGHEMHSAWQRLGFDRSLICPLNQIDCGRLLATLEPIYDRLVARGKIPDGAHVLSLRNCSPDEVAELVTSALGGTHAAMKNRVLGRHPQRLDPDTSRVLTVSGRVRGVLLASPAKNDAAWVEANVLHSSVRGRWANVWLKIETVTNALALGIHTVNYETYSQHDDTLKLTARLGGVVTPRVELYRIIAPPPRLAIPTPT